eukprot:Gregarina_sp_Poly_1__7479@NODE_416_length_8734_cov_134_157609_g338_i0_p5_GENE_NODE_416_length_8734_cov_134_157609_g338_i0NODE_416_length_8734_cov_134_157609_g338_i0_p5_ORF_typecomplete_len374_score34_65_NODE_416_length_8734_cov_134_157609_g338_i069468067
MNGLCNVWDVVELLADSNKVLQSQNARLRDMLTELVSCHKFERAVALPSQSSNLTYPSMDTRHLACPSGDMQPAPDLNVLVHTNTPRGQPTADAAADFAGGTRSPPKSPRKLLPLTRRPEPRPSTSPPMLKRETQQPDCVAGNPERAANSVSTPNVMFVRTQPPRRSKTASVFQPLTSASPFLAGRQPSTPRGVEGVRIQQKDAPHTVPRLQQASPLTVSPMVSRVSARQRFQHTLGHRFATRGDMYLRHEALNESPIEPSGRGYFHPLSAMAKDGPLAWTLARPTARRPGGGEFAKVMLRSEMMPPPPAKLRSSGDVMSPPLTRGIVQRFSTNRPRPTPATSAFFSAVSGEGATPHKHLSLEASHLHATSGS